MTDRSFRFGVVSGGVQSPGQWTKFVHRVEDTGYASLMIPDAFGGTAPFPALASAAAVSTGLRLGTFVLAAPLRTPTSIAWDAASVDRLSGGRLELGLGAGRPGAKAEADLLGVPFGSPGERVEQVARTIEVVRTRFADAIAAADAQPGEAMSATGGFLPVQRPTPPILIAGNGRKLLTVAAEHADIVSIGLAADPTERALGERVAMLRELAGDRFDELELNLNIFSVGTEIPPWMAQFGVDASRAADNQDVRVLTGDLAGIADVLRRRRDEFGISYVMVNSFAAEAFAPLVEQLAGH
ncbi:MAG TPA: TIGR03621 family F420-dependent LLM class oxidoreductase [Pseudonocardiaceae bacterium]|jgi:probable F420-dependent oxidoreductase|nr:TIGR03621 family F420-dependent LLM class oxidoreductase [Pseudonocardiaceae bacterium]